MHYSLVAAGSDHEGCGCSCACKRGAALAPRNNAGVILGYWKKKWELLRYIGLYRGYAGDILELY